MHTGWQSIYMLCHFFFLKSGIKISESCVLLVLLASASFLRRTANNFPPQSVEFRVQFADQENNNIISKTRVSSPSDWRLSMEIVRAENMNIAKINLGVKTRQLCKINSQLQRQHHACIQTMLIKITEAYANIFLKILRTQSKLWSYLPLMFNFIFLEKTHIISESTVWRHVLIAAVAGKT